VFSKGNITLSSEMEILSNLLKELTISVDDLNKPFQPILDDIEFYLHNLDNAVYFTDIGGVDVISNLVNTSSDTSLVAKCALVLGVACQRYLYTFHYHFWRMHLPINTCYLFFCRLKTCALVVSLSLHECY